MSATTRLLAALSVTLATTSAYAQTAKIPSAADPAKVDQRFDEQPLAPSQSAPITREGVGAAVNPATENQRFILRGVKFSGMTIYGADRFNSLFKDKVGKEVSVADIQRVAQKITQQYVADGYILAVAYVPTQTIDREDTITIQVEEGHIGRVFFEGEKPRDHVRNLAATYANKLREASPLRTDVLERYLLLINDLPGANARAVLRPSTTEKGATDVVILYTEKPVDAAFTTDNRGSRYIGPWQNSVAVMGNDILGMDERTVLRSVVSSPANELRYFDLQHEEQLGSEGTKFITTVSHASVNPGEELDALNIKGISDDLELKVTHPFKRSRLENVTARGVFDMRNSDTDILGTQISKDHVRSLRAGMRYDIADNYKGVNVIDAEASQGVDVLGATEDGAGRTRINGKQDYTKFNMAASRSQALPDKFSLMLTSSGQYALDSLLSSEQFSLGGPNFGTAYDPSELSGDHGLAGKIELRYGDSVGQKYFESYQLYTYYDVGRVWRKNPLAGETGHESLSSRGIGVRANLTPLASANLELSVPQTREIASEPRTSSRLYGGVTMRY